MISDAHVNDGATVLAGALEILNWPIRICGARAQDKPVVPHSRAIVQLQRLGPRLHLQIPLRVWQERRWSTVQSWPLTALQLLKGRWRELIPGRLSASS